MEREFSLPPDRQEAPFATDVGAVAQRGMIWLHFFQRNPLTEQERLVSQVVLRPDRLDDLIARLSDLRDR